MIINTAKCNLYHTNPQDIPFKLPLSELDCSLVAKIVEQLRSHQISDFGIYPPTSMAFTEVVLASHSYNYILEYN